MTHRVAMFGIDHHVEIDTRSKMARFAVACLLFMVPAMIALGGVVHGTGSSLACPDWPLCFGEAMPAMTGGIFYEHGHRLLGAAIGAMMIVLSVGLFRRERARVKSGLTYGLGLSAVLVQLVVFGAAVSSGALGSLWFEALCVTVFAASVYRLASLGMSLTALGLVGLELVVLQGLLGGLTVVWRLPPLVSTLHLAVAMALLGILAFLALRLHPDARMGRSIAGRGLLVIAIAALSLQIVVGGFMRHTGSTLACGVDLLSCQGEWWGSGGAAHTALGHRWFAIVVTGLIIAATLPLLRAARSSGRRAVRGLAIGSHGLVALQVALGFLTLAFYVPVSLATLHQTLAAVLLVDLVALHVVTGPWGARFDDSVSEPVEMRGPRALGAA
ncbi:MAG: COX15/CtaA family protein [Myxococcota bacterium]